MLIDVENLVVVHNPAESRFEAWIEGQLNKLDYFRDEDTLVITHVGVHPDFRGQGVAGKIVQASLEHARGNLLRVIPMCPYAAAYIRKNPQYQDLVQRWSEE